MEKCEYSNFTIGMLIRKFYYNHESLLIYDHNILKGAITYSSFINETNLDCMIRNVVFVNSENEIETGDLISVYCIQTDKDIREISRKVDSRYSFNIERFKCLYDQNDIIINYLKSLNLSTIYVSGNEKEYLIRFIKMYGLPIEVKEINDDEICDLLSKKYLNTLIIDTTGFNIELYKKINSIMGENYLVYDLNQLAELAEIFNFATKFSKQEEIKTFVFRYPEINELTNLTEEEHKRIEFDHYYKYYYDGYLNNGKFEGLLKKVFKEFFSREFIKSRYTMPKVYSKGGTFYLEDSNNSYCLSVNGMRITTNQLHDYSSNINMFGPCIVFSPLSDDYHTLPSYVQRLVNNYNFDYRVNNYGARAINFAENLRTTRDINLYSNDVMIYIINSKEAEVLNQMGFKKIYSLTSVFNNSNLRDYFIDEPIHCNHEACNYIANYIFKIVGKDLKYIIRKEECRLISCSESKNIFEGNKDLQNYLKYLESLTHFNGLTGAIVMNCNPFTYGHYNIIKYASTQVDRLIVFVVEEDKSYFKFNERFQMIKEGCKDFLNVIVISSGNLLASATLFPEYFNKEDNSDVTVDASKDIAVFTKYIAPYLGITKRFVGEENFDKVTQAYNIALKHTLPLYGIDVEEVPRFKDAFGQEISAKVVRKNYEHDNWEKLELQVPISTIKVLKLKKGGN